jgi:hypothetical protein
MKIIRVTVEDYKKIIDDLKEQRKIAAIKKVREVGGVGLKEAKHAVERLQYEKCGEDQWKSLANSSVHKIVCGPAIKKIVLDYGNGDIEVDLEGLQMRALMEMQYVGLDVCRDILDLVDALKAYSDGAPIGIVSREKNEREEQDR